MAGASGVQGNVQGGPSRRGEALFAAVVTLAFAVAVSLGASWHEMWRDELRAWLIARDSITPLALLENIECEGHPALWYLLVWPITRFTHDPEAMKLLNLPLMAAAVFLIARFAPGPKIVRALIAFGYFPVYEYGVLARNYAIGILGLVAFCIAFPHRRRHPLVLGAVLLLTAHTSLVACVLSLAATLALGVEAFVSSRGRSGASATCETVRELPHSSMAGWYGWAGIGLAFVGVATSALQMRPSARCAYDFNIHHQWSAWGGAFGTIPVAFVPILRSGSRYWGPPIMKAGGVALLVIPWCSLALCRRSVAWLYHLAATMGLIVFFFVAYNGELRHHGFLFVGFATAGWMAYYLPARTLPRRLDVLARGAERSLWRITPIILLLHVVAAAVALAGERKYVFSGSRGAAEIIRAHGLEARPIVGDQDEAASSVLAWLDRERAFYPAGARWASYPVYDQARLRPYDLWREVGILADRMQSPVTVVLNHAPGTLAPGPDRLIPIGCQEAPIRWDESLCVYEYRPGGSR